MSAAPEDMWEVHAVRYGHHKRTAAENFLDGDPHNGPMPMDYFVWVVRNEDRTFLLDTGFGAKAAAARGRELVRPVEDGLKALGVQPDALTDVVLSHMHYDHAGNLDRFPAARFHVQDSEMAFCTGRRMCDHGARAAFSASDVQAMVGKLFDGRVVFHEGESQFAPGITLHHMGGHTAGLQVMRVKTQRGWVVLASDAAHYYRNWIERRPFPIVEDVEEYLAAYAKIEALATSNNHIIPGHDPAVMDLYPASLSGAPGIVRLDVDPKQSQP